MDKYCISATTKTPSITFDKVSGFLEIKGRSLPENSYEFFKPLNNLLNEYVSDPKPITTISLNLDYFSTSTSKFILDFLRKFESIYECGKKVNVAWYYQDEDILEAGEDYQSMVRLPFTMLPSAS